jgi:hypothetical protein
VVGVRIIVAHSTGLVNRKTHYELIPFSPSLAP